MIPLPNSLVEQLTRHLPLIMAALDTGSLDNRTYNAVHLTRKAVRRMEKAINDRHDEKKDNRQRD